MLFKDISTFIWLLFCSGEQYRLGYLGRRTYKEHLGEFEFGSAVQEVMSFKDFSIFSSGGHLVRRSLTLWAILVGGTFV